MLLKENGFWQTKAHGTLFERYRVYLDLADDGEGIDITTGEELLTFEEWLEK